VATLKSIELAGFKSFAKRTKIEFGNGLVGIVGPNGSGKSNIADAVRWVFGEQKNRSLRSDKSEDLIYHGGKDKSQASMAEVIITLDNSDGSIPIDLNEIEITRRLYRSGESNYLLNGRKTTLSLIQEILSASGFGVGSYTVIGQGMIDRLILSSGTERKQLFEEASGIKKYEIKLSQTTKRIEATRDNLSQITNLINELSPQYDSLLRQSELLNKRNNLNEQLQQLRLAYAHYQTKEIDKVEGDLLRVLESIKVKIEKNISSIKQLEADDSKVVSINPKAAGEKINKEIINLEFKREKLDFDLTKLNIELEQINALINDTDPVIEITKKEIKNLKANLSTHIKDQKLIEKLVEKYEMKIKKFDEKINAQTKILEDTRKALAKSQKSEYLKHSLGLIDIIQDGVKRQKDEAELGIVFYKLKRMIKHSLIDNSAELALKVGKIQNSIARLLDERESISELQTNEIIKIRAIEMDYSSIESKIDDLNRSLARIEKANDNTRHIARHEILKAREEELGTKRHEVNELINMKRQEFVSLTESIMQNNKDEYYKKHEQMTNEKVGLEQEKLNVESNISNVKARRDSLNSTVKSWGMPKELPKPAKLESASIEDINKAEAEIDHLEEINPDIIKQAEEVGSQMSYLNSQKIDLEKAVINLETVASETSQKMSKVFEKGFEKINKNFSVNFKQLFGGGDAGLKLNKGEEKGIDIVVKLPNKKVQNISSLSGGEKALASVALLSGILASNPSPFVVLDEVDAALDAENTKKFADVLTKITKHSQVLVVTHNYDTMAVADELIGVTTSGNNDSQIINVKLDNLPQD
jgi:chromosome segregation protein